MKSRILLILLLFCLLSCTRQNATNNIFILQNLRCEHQENPDGIDVLYPILSWQISPGSGNISQSAFQLLVATSIDKLDTIRADVWNSGKVISDNSVTLQYAGKKLESGKEYFWKVKIWDQEGNLSSWSTPATWSMGLLSLDDWKARWISYPRSQASALPYFRKIVNLKWPVKRAMAYVSGLGYFELYVNGKKIGDHVLDPAQTNYDKYAFYVTYPIASSLTNGMNTFGVMLGEGWYSQEKVWGRMMKYGEPILICQIVIEYLNGEKETLVSDTSWKWTEGPVISANVYAGETYDARREIPDWCRFSPDDTRWKNALVADRFPPVLCSQPLPPIRKMKEILTQKLFQTKKGIWVFDLGRNFAGWARICLNEPAGTAIKIRTSEELNPDQSLNTKTIGSEATGVDQCETYICKGNGEETWEPRFTYHGFRYAEVTGLTFEPTLATLTGVQVYSSVKTAGSFECSSEQINQLHQMAVQTVTSNLHGFSSDCPTREKCGWLGDAHTVAPMSMCNFDMESFWIKYLHDIRSSASITLNTLFHKSENKVFYNDFKSAGIPFMIAPGKRWCGAASPDWGTALVQIPWYLYLQYGNYSILKDFYPDMKIWVDYLEKLSKNNIIEQGLGDWCPPGSNTTIDCPYQLSSTSFYYLDLSIMEKSARILNKDNEAEAWSRTKQMVKEAFIKRFYHKNLHTFGSQTANSLALDFGLAPEGEEKLISDAIAADVITKHQGFYHAGIFGLPRVFASLCRYGNEETAYKILTKEGNPGFDRMWKVYNATTLWEVLPVDNYYPEENPGIRGESHNHPMQAGFDAWFFEGIAGINSSEDFPGFKQTIFRPYLTSFLKFAKASYSSSYGNIVSDWKWEGKNFIWNFEIPANTSGKIYIPKLFPNETILLNNSSVSVQNLEQEKNFGQFWVYKSLPSGKYTIKISS